MTGKKLFDKALKARELAYAPYSQFFVGAALLCSDGSVYTGCNVENSAHTATCCAERVALFKAVSEGKRDFVAIAVAGGKEGDIKPCYPCGVCRQALSELCRGELEIFLGDGEDVIRTTLAELLPHAFELEI